MVDSGKLKALSLSHTINVQTGKIIPEEVSLCILGKRAGTEIMKDADGSLNMMTFKCSGSDSKSRSLLFDEFNNSPRIDKSHGKVQRCKQVKYSFWFDFSYVCTFT